MKKFLSSILAVVYLSTSMGATVHFHYCMGKLVSWGLHDNESKICTYCGMTKGIAFTEGSITSNPCCTDQHKHIKASGDQKAALPVLQIQKNWTEVPVITPKIPDHFHAISFVADNPCANGPPGLKKLSLFVLNCNYRI